MNYVSSIVLVSLVSFCMHGADPVIKIPAYIDIEYYATDAARLSKIPTDIIRIRITPSVTPREIQQWLVMKVGPGNLMFGSLPIDNTVYANAPLSNLLRDDDFANFQAFAGLLSFLGQPAVSGHETKQQSSSRNTRPAPQI